MTENRGKHNIKTKFGEICDCLTETFVYIGFVAKE